MGEHDTLERPGPVPASLVAVHRELLTLLGGCIATQAVAVVATLGVADLVDEEAVPAAELAERSGAHAPSLERFLRLLSSMGIFAEEEPGCFRHTERSRCLRSDAPGSLRSLAILFGTEFYRAWSCALHSARTGEPAFDRAFGEPYFELLAHDADANDRFNRAMADGAQARVLPLLDYDWNGVERVVDVGGGNGSLLVSLLGAHEHLQGMLVDQPHVVSGARALIERAELADRCTVASGDFFESVPSGDAYVLSHILHDWDDEHAVRILESCRRSLAPGGRLLLLEHVVPSGNEPAWAKWVDVHMLILHGGRERTEEEWRSLLDAGGFRLERVIDGARTSLLEARPTRP